MRNLFVYTLLYIALFAEAQLRYPIVGTYKGKSAQGMAICGDKAFLFNDGGHCRVLNLKSGIFESEFDLASSENKPHVATACFGNEILENGNYPLLYVAEFVGKSRCFVECINNDSSVLVQTIEAKDNGKNYRIQCWLVDNSSNHLYSVSGKQTVDSMGRCPVVIRKYRLPLVSEGDYILLTEQDKREQFELDFPNCLQGATIRNGKMYVATGFQQSQWHNPRGRRSLKVIDLKKKKVVKDIDLTYITTNEPEGFDFHGRNALLFCGQEGGIYKINH